MSDQFIQPVIRERISNPDSAEVRLVTLIMRADNLSRLSDETSYRLSDPNDPLRLAASRIDFGLDAISSASFFLGAAANSILALRLLTIREIADVNGSMNVSANITINGTAGLVRQALECAARAHWLTNAPSADQLSLRGYATVWENAYQSVAYANAINSPDLAEKKAMFAELLEDGRSRGWINDNGQKPQPKRFFLPSTDILRGIKFAPGEVEPFRGILGSKVNSGEWVYSWLSGMAHGHVWSHASHPAGTSEGEMNIVRTGPDWIRLALATSLAVRLMESVLEAMGRVTPLNESRARRS